ncbi:MerR family transcriptional regulator [Enterobacter cloacae]|nr:MerR family transcriptional regulator [Enterobacter cloacae]
MSYTISEFSKRCGVPPTTLRAWQCRYGLLKPMRTEGGHRIYNEDDIKQAFMILEWIKKGVPVSQIRPLLAGSTTAVTNNWIETQELMMQKLKSGKFDSLRRYIFDCGREYPHQELVDEVLRPLRHRLPPSVPVMRMLREIFDGQIIAYTSYCMESDKKAPGENYVVAGWHVNDLTEIWMEVLTRTGQGMRIDILPFETSKLIPEIFPDHNWLIVTSSKLTVVRKKQIAGWKKLIRSFEVIMVG